MGGCGRVGHRRRIFGSVSFCEVRALRANVRPHLTKATKNIQEPACAQLGQARAQLGLVACVSAAVMSVLQDSAKPGRYGYSPHDKYSTVNVMDEEVLFNIDSDREAFQNKFQMAKWSLMSTAYWPLKTGVIYDTHANSYDIVGRHGGLRRLCRRGGLTECCVNARSGHIAESRASTVFSDKTCERGIRTRLGWG